MGEVLVKEIYIFGIYDCLPGLNEDWDGAVWFDAIDAYKNVNVFLESHGKTVAQMIEHLPHLEEGIIGDSRAASCYFFGNTLVANEFEPCFDGDLYKVLVAGRIQDKESIDGTLRILKKAAGRGMEKYWKDGREKIVKVPDKLEDFSAIAGYLPSIMGRT
jgi:hypothetical protein